MRNLKEKPQYERAAVKAVQLLKSGDFEGPRRAWDSAIWGETDSGNSADKGCPRGAFLGLCEAGRVKGVPSGDYCRSGKKRNKNHTLKVLELLEEKYHGQELPEKTKLWSEAVENVPHNGQLDVLYGLWKEELIVTRKEKRKWPDTPEKRKEYLEKLGTR